MWAVNLYDNYTLRSQVTAILYIRFVIYVYSVDYVNDISQIRNVDYDVGLSLRVARYAYGNSRKKAVVVEVRIPFWAHHAP